MKIFRFPGIIIGVCAHVIALVVILTNPGCSSSTKPAPAAAETAGGADMPPVITVPIVSPPVSFAADNVRYSPTRPGTPVAATLEIEPVSNVTPATTYTIVSNDNLTTIAKKNHLTVSELAAANNLNANTAKLHPGQKLIIPGKAPAPPKMADAATPASASAIANAPAVAEAAAPFKHTVKARETLSSIAQKYGVKLSEIAVANNISDPQKIRLGSELIIPGWQATGGKSPAAAKSGGSTTAKPASSTRLVAAPMPASDPTPPPTTSIPEIPVIQIEEVPASAK